MEILQSGAAKSVAKKDNSVVRELQVQSESVHRLLNHLEEQACTCVPKFLTKDDTHEYLSYMDGQVYDYPLQGNVASENALLTAAQRLREFHDASAGFITQAKELSWAFEAREPVQVMCHADYAPYNVVLSGDEVTGIFDFDLVHPGPRLWDLAYAIYCWSPFKTTYPDALGSLAEQVTRAKLFCDAYGLTADERLNLVDSMVERLTVVVDFMRQQAAAGNSQFTQNIEDGHHLAYLDDIEYLKLNHEFITKSIGG